MTAMKEHGKITERQFAALIANTMIGVGILTLPRTAAQSVGTGGISGIILAGFFSLISLLIILKLGLVFPDKTIVEFLPEVIGKYPGNFFSLLIIIYWFFISALALRVFSELLLSAIFDKTPLNVLILTMLLTMLFFLRHDVQVIARINEIYLFFIIFTAILGISLVYKKIEYINLFPFLGDKGISGLFKGSFNLLFAYLGFEISSVLIPSITTKKLTYNYGVKGFLIPFILYVLVVFAGIGVFSAEELINMTWPTMELVKVTNIPGIVFERLEALFISFWVLAVFTTVSNFYYASILSLTQLFKLDDHKTLLFPLSPLLYIISLSPCSIFRVFAWVDYAGYLGGIIILIYLLVYAIVLFKRLKGAS